MLNELPSLTGWAPIASAPRNGLTILVADPDCGVFAMGWMAGAKNPLVGDVTGLWETPDRSMTWSEQDGAGPTLWRHLPEAASAAATTNSPSQQGKAQ